MRNSIPAIPPLVETVAKIAETLRYCGNMLVLRDAVHAVARKAALKRNGTATNAAIDFEARLLWYDLMIEWEKESVQELHKRLAAN